MVLSSSLKQKLNVMSSTKGKLVVAHYGLSVVLWNKNFIEAQGYTVEQKQIYQDNKITILIENNERASISNKTEHIKVTYFFIKEHIDQGDVEVE